MSALDLLDVFLQWALTRKRERYIGFARNESTRRKFLAALHHDFRECMDQRYAVHELPEATLDAPALLFAPPSTFGEPLESLRTAHGSFRTSFLAISNDGRAAICRPETMMDAELLLQWRPEQ